MALILSPSADGLRKKWPERTGPAHQVVQPCFRHGGTRRVKPNGVCQRGHRHGVPTNKAGGKRLM